MITQERALETLRRYKIDETQLAAWEETLGLDIPRDTFGNKTYSQLHLNLFKNIKKHLTLGRSLSEIKRMLILPTPLPQEATPATATVPAGVAASLSKGSYSVTVHPIPEPPASRASITETTTALASPLQHIEPAAALPAPQVALALSPHPPIARPQEPVLLPEHQPLKGLSIRTARHLKRFSSPPQRLSKSLLKRQQGANTGLLLLVDNLMAEKDALQEKTLLLEKQKVHLLQTNELLHHQVRGLTQDVAVLKEQIAVQLKAQENFKLMDDKSRLQKQLIDSEQRQAEVEKKFVAMNHEIQHLQATVANKMDPRLFLGNWLEEAELVEVHFDNFGINIESHRSRLFKITQVPDRCFGQTAVIETAYDYQTNTLWKRHETLTLAVLHENRLEGEMTAEYNLDGTPVARALYKIRCQRQGVRKPERPATLPMLGAASPA